MYLRLAEFLLCAIAIWFIITQIIIPGFYGTKSFPIFKKEAKLKRKINRDETGGERKGDRKIKKGLEDRKINDDTETINPKEGA